MFDKERKVQYAEVAEISDKTESSSCEIVRMRKQMCAGLAIASEIVS